MPSKPEGFNYSQSTTQAFYFVEKATFDGIELSKDDLIVAYNENVVVGSWPWKGAYTTVPAMGYDGSDNTTGYLEADEIPTFKLLREDGSLSDMNIIGDVEGWSSNGVDVIELSGSTPVPTELTLNEAYPNPFNPSTNISFSLPQEMHVSLAIYDISGRMVSELVNEIKGANDYNVVWNANLNASGVYFVKLTAGNAVHTQNKLHLRLDLHSIQHYSHLRL
jgi:hypothetical protein